MSEQINLYQAHFHRRRVRCSAARMGTVLGALLGLVAVLALLDGWRLLALDGRLAELDRDFESLRTQRAAVEKKMAERAPDPRLVAQIAKLEAVLAHQLPLQQILAQDFFAADAGYSDYFVALARQHLEGLWLTGVRIGGAGRDLALDGRTVDPALVPRYLQRLSGEPVLAGTDFTRFQMQRPSGGDGKEKVRGDAIEFAVATAREE